MADTISRTDIRLIKGVPFNSDYKHSRWFNTKATQTAYFNSKPVVFSANTANFQRVEGHFRFKAPMHVEDLVDVNYITFRNKSKQYYGFVTHIEYSNNNVSTVHFQLDVLQTYMFDMDFKRSYVTREHMNRWNSSGAPTMHTVPEGLQYGDEYDTNGAVHVRNQNNVRFLVIISKDQLHDVETYTQPSYIVNPQPLYYYIIPFTPNGIACDLTIDGDNVFLSNPHVVLDGLYQLETTVNSVVSMYVTDDVGIPILSTEGGTGNKDKSTLYLDDRHVDMERVGFHSGGDTAGYGMYIKRITKFMPTEFSLTGNYWSDLVGNGVDKPRESKTLMSPYHMIQLHDFRGNTVDIKPERIYGNELIIVRKGSLGISNKVSYHVKNYNMDSEKLGIAVYHEQVSNQHALIDNNPQDVTVKNEHLAAFMQGNRNQLVNQNNSAVMNGLFSAIGGGIGAGASQTPTQTGGLSRNAGFGVASAVTSGAQGLSNTVLQIQGIQATQKDIANVPASISKMGNNTAYDIGNGYFGIFVVYKGIKAEYMQILEEYFRMFGYKSNRVKVPNFHTREHFNYVQTIDCIILGDFNNKYIEELKQVFNSGITLWHTDLIGNYALANNEID